LNGGEALQSVLADLSPAVEAQGEEEGRQSLDLQVADMARNVVQYQALLKGWSKRMSILSAAINEGKR
jgi:flagellar basal-body rod protein FlgB